MDLNSVLKTELILEGGGGDVFFTNTLRKFN